MKRVLMVMAMVMAMVGLAGLFPRALGTAGDPAGDVRGRQNAAQAATPGSS